ncbi:hypothetical protein EIK77_007948 [Talaromyces pinophilus]|nr:hypothetical protein EIK77_007948 [Talaromyces pinophilus]
MTDGLIDFAFMVRGCSIVTRYLVEQYQSSEMFKLLMPNDIYAHVWPLLSAEPFHSPEMVDACIETLEGIQPLLLQQDDTPRYLTYNAILSTYQAMKISAQQAFLAFTFIYSSWEHMTDREFIEFLDPGDPVSSLLLIHFVTATIMMRRIFEALRLDQVNTPRDALANHHWGIHRYESLPAKFRGLVEWQYKFITADKAFIERLSKTCKRHYSTTKIITKKKFNEYDRHNERKKGGLCLRSDMNRTKLLLPVGIEINYEPFHEIPIPSTLEDPRADIAQGDTSPT